MAFGLDDAIAAGKDDHQSSHPRSGGESEGCG
jgi:hypothetical protein